MGARAVLTQTSAAEKPPRKKISIHNTPNNIIGGKLLLAPYNVICAVFVCIVFKRGKFN